MMKWWGWGDPNLRFPMADKPSLWPWVVQKLGITSATPDIDGGHIGRGPDGSPDGLLWDAACDLLTGDDGVKIGRHGPNIHLPESPARLTQLLEDAQTAFLRAEIGRAYV